MVHSSNFVTLFHRQSFVLYGISRTVKLDRSVSGVGITGVPGAGASLKIFTLYLHVTQLFAHVIGFFECAIGTGVCRGISNQA